MPIRDRVIWGHHNPFSDPRLASLDMTVRAIRRNGPLPTGVTRRSVFENLRGDLPAKPPGYYREYDVAPPDGNGRGMLRLVVGLQMEIYITGDHYGNFRQIVNMPF